MFRVRSRHARRRARVVVVRGTCIRREATAVLRALEAEPESRDVVVRVSKPGAVLSAVDAQRVQLVGAHAAHVHLEGRPRPQAFGNLLRELCRIASQFGRLLREQASRRVIAMAVAFVPLEAREQHPRPRHADDADDVAHGRFGAPLVERFVEALRETVVHDGREVLLVDPVVLVRRQQFVRADEREPVEELRADRVVAALSARERHERDACAVPATEHRKHSGVLVIRVRSGVEHAGRGADLENLLPCSGCAAVLRN